MSAIATHPVMSSAAEKRHQAIVEQTRKWVAQSFYGTLLKQMRKSPFKSDLFEGGQAGEMFEGMFDQEIADRMVRGAPSKLVDAIVRKIEHGGESPAFLGSHKHVPTVKPNASALG